MQSGGIFVQVGQPEFIEGTLGVNSFEIICKECTLVGNWFPSKDSDDNSSLVYNSSL